MARNQVESPSRRTNSKGKVGRRGFLKGIGLLTAALTGCHTSNRESRITPTPKTAVLPEAATAVTPPAADIEARLELTNEIKKIKDEIDGQYDELQTAIENIETIINQAKEVYENEELSADQALDLMRKIADELKKIQEAEKEINTKLDQLEEINNKKSDILEASLQQDLKAWIKSKRNSLKEDVQAAADLSSEFLPILNELMLSKWKQESYIDLTGLSLEEAQYFLDLYQKNLMPDNIRSVLFMNGEIKLSQKLKKDLGSEHEGFAVLSAVGFDLNNFGLIYQVQEVRGADESLRHWFSGLGYSPDLYTEGDNGFCHEPSSLIHPKTGKKLFPIFTEVRYGRTYKTDGKKHLSIAEWLEEPRIVDQLLDAIQAGVDAYIAEYWQYIDEDKLDFDVRTFFEENSITFFLMDENPREQDRFQLNGMSNHLGISAMGVEKIEMEGGSMNFIVRSSGSKKDVIDARTSGLEAFNSIMFALEAILISQIRPQLQIAIDQSGENTPFTEAMQLELIIPRHQNQEVFNDTFPIKISPIDA